MFCPEKHVVGYGNAKTPDNAKLRSGVYYICLRNMGVGNHVVVLVWYQQVLASRLGLSAFQSAMGGMTPMAITSSRRAQRCL